MEVISLDNCNLHSNHCLKLIEESLFSISCIDKDSELYDKDKIFDFEDKINTNKDKSFSDKNIYYKCKDLKYPWIDETDRNHLCNNSENPNMVLEHLDSLPEGSYFIVKPVGADSKEQDTLVINTQNLNVATEPVKDIGIVEPLKLLENIEFRNFSESEYSEESPKSYSNFYSSDEISTQYSPAAICQNNNNSSIKRESYLADELIPFSQEFPIHFFSKSGDIQESLNKSQSRNDKTKLPKIGNSFPDKFRGYPEEQFLPHNISAAVTNHQNISAENLQDFTQNFTPKIENKPIKRSTGSPGYRKIYRPRKKLKRNSCTEKIITEVPKIHRDIFEEAKTAYIEVVEQPMSKALRFRYMCEGRSAGSIPGVRSTHDNKTYPSIALNNCSGPALIIVSCVTGTEPFKPHPHNLVGKEGCSGGICSVLLKNGSMRCSFPNLGIQCVKKVEIDNSLEKRKSKGVDPFQTGFEHQKYPQNIDLNVIRLCFQAYLIDENTDQRVELTPIVSDPIFDKKSALDLSIFKLSSHSSYVCGGEEIILLCDKVVKEDIQIRFYEAADDSIIWEDFGIFHSSDVYKQVAICFKTPKYKDLQIKDPVQVWVQLLRPSDLMTSPPLPFQFHPIKISIT